MKKIGFVRGVATAGNVLTNVLKVFVVLGAVGILLGVLSLSFLPGDFISVTIDSGMTAEVNFRSLLGEGWEEQKDLLLSAFAGDVTETENGVRLSESVESVKINNRLLAISLIPTMVELILLFALLNCLSKAFREWKHSPNPFPFAVGGHLRYAAAFLFAMEIAPGFCSALISLFTGAELITDSSWDLTTVFLGFVLIALSYLFEYGASLKPAPATPVENEENKTDPRAF